ncbi:MAG: hypothetical protein COW00_18725 [Bdellovibrio sp. CG12_big_fil_rev_8_21_14_0_65_39_13]|nr:MAG: hypothetical protein COW78_10730 [Bdellovibrio sp. CG22_combo_CG10-13_8_21_14_all_39_27]PIQ57851.1 MAG: hypothetical protein COW00_18725 [Bdellovibrio sp. CG12_big_fil_rev_8_21_14_0_65_39_13]PIR36126.1 MAG: hypothetical protein COV37_05110 [Bdellovibrio sp. CG11_big_fil_rev_8_21_14_0_20_39_38]PJB54502.1 MAG: hypothetical protein CO099_01215 [Bdellovibrio sp. CG_4_9_14_3_um_filter_39_7]
MENFEICYSHNNKKPVYQGEVDQSLTVTNATQDLVNFKSEFNIGLALPFEFCKSKKSEKFEKHSMTKWFDEAGNLNRLEMIFRGNSGTAGKLDQDVLNILMSMCVEQNTDSPVFTYEDIRRRLGLAKGSHGNIRDSIQRMLGMRIEFRQSFYSATNSKNINVEKHLIQSRKSVINEDYSDLKNIDARHSVTFDRDIMQNLLNGYYSVLSRETYLSLDSGAVRRLYQHIVSHREVSKRNHFTLEIEDIASVIGLTAKKEFFGHVKKYFNSLKEALPELEFTFATVNRKKVVKISFIGDQNLIGNDDEFFQSLAKWYGVDVLEKNGIGVDYLNDIREKFPKSIIYEKTRIKLCELYLDMIFHQKIVNHSQVQSVKALLTSALTQKTEYMKPDGFKKFVVDRVKHKEILETKAMALREDEKKKFELQLQEKQTKLLAQTTFENLKLKNPKTYEKYENEAMKLWGDEIRESLLAEQILEEKIKELIQNRMETGEQITQ